MCLHITTLRTVQPHIHRQKLQVLDLSWTTCASFREIREAEEEVTRTEGKLREDDDYDTETMSAVATVQGATTVLGNGVLGLRATTTAVRGGSRRARR